MSSMDCTFDEEMNEVVTMERGMPKYVATYMIATRANLLLDKFLARTSKQDNSHNLVDIRPLQTLLSPLSRI